MSIIEMKALALEKITALTEEAAVKEILLHLETLSVPQPKFETDAFFEKASTKYDDVLQKLAQ